MPTSSDLVTDLPADFETFGQAVATSMADLLGGTTGQVLSKASNTDMDFTWVAQDDSNAIQNAIVDAKGDLIGATAADTPARLAVGTNGQVLTADSTAATGLAWATPSTPSNLFYAGKNRIINGDFGINQRNFTSNTVTGSYGFDRYQQLNSGGTSTVTPQTFTLGAAPVSGYEGTNFVRIVTASQSAAGDYALIQNKVESVRSFAGQTVTFSAWAKASTGTPKIGLTLEQQFGTGGSSSVITSAATTTITTSWARYSFTLSVPSISGKTIGAGDFLSAMFFTSAGTTISGSGYPAVGIQNVTIDTWGWQLEAGSTATDFVTASGGSPQAELAMCQRYYYLHASGATALIGSGSYNTATNANSAVIFPVQMRIAPTLVATTGTNYYQVTGGGVDDGCNSLTLFIPTVQATQLYNNSEVSGTIGYGVIMRTSNAAASVAFNAEL